MRLELVFFTGCPHVDLARANLKQALHLLGSDQEWVEWNLDDAATPDAVRGYASPAVLLDGKELFGEKKAHMSMRACSARRAPSVDAIIAAVRARRIDRAADGGNVE